MSAQPEGAPRPAYPPAPVALVEGDAPRLAGVVR
jgi:hypothetical protein